MKPKHLGIAAALVFATSLAVAPKASAQVVVSGYVPVPHGVVSFQVGNPYYRSGYYAPRRVYRSRYRYYPRYRRSYCYAPSYGYSSYGYRSYPTYSGSYSGGYRCN